jgi:hypothetical protein
VEHILYGFIRSVQNAGDSMNSKTMIMPEMKDDAFSRRKSFERVVDLRPQLMTEQLALGIAADSMVGRCIDYAVRLARVRLDDRLALFAELFLSP